MFDKKKEYIIVSATALAASGALTILRQFIQHAANDINNYIVFVPVAVDLPSHDNIIYVKNSPKGWAKRIYWDWIGCKIFLMRHSIKVKKIICLQNSSINVPYPQIIYLHQPIPFSEFDFFLKEFSFSNIKLLLYKKFYALFIFKFINEKTIFVVQTEWMKESVLNKCKKLRKNQVIVIKPDLKVLNEIKEDEKISRKTLLYPATALSYKNHIVILKALTQLVEKYHIHDIKFQVTFDEGEYKNFDRFVYKNNLLKNIEYLGVISYNELQKEYKRASLVVFPSYIESYGLPLIEAASLGKRIVCSDLPYARDVLDNYEGSIFVKYNDVDEWAFSITRALDIISGTPIRPYENNNRSSWPDFFKLI
ncbi:glycosyltransferase [Citrobacter freundii]|uniref:glycosyltransferase n=1 Tax=Citrobacter TaxID=544 RepID=UPI002577949C|nr:MULTISPECIES: glycosyltransferase [Citrobacter]MDM3090431.1 glycosyltransferase [Citrobacter sp. Cf133]MDT7441004.1 glycosyltransferase [Citrobacter freundii]MDT9378153.1 glycosyltransferase [Citrobacter freundii]MEB2712202.1 glycosyltransferase [Citrobacter freundii]MEB2759558.1 glycosyltransferase [Citrobacter freundii]